MEYLLVTEYVVKYNKDTGNVRRLIQHGRISAQKTVINGSFQQTRRLQIAESRPVYIVATQQSART